MYQKFYSKKSIVTYVLSILISGIEFSSGVNPLGMAMFGAIGGVSIPLIIPCVIIGIVTCISFGPIAMLKFIGSAVIFALLQAFVKDDKNKTNDAIKVVTATLIPEIVMLLITGTLLYDALLAVYLSILTAVFYLIFNEGLTAILDIRNKKVLSAETLIAMGIMASIAISGIGNFSILGVSIRGIVSVLIVLLLGWKRGAAVGAASGISISIVMGLIGVSTPAIIAAYGFSGLLSGVFSKFGKAGAAIGFILGNIVLAFYANGSTEVLISIKEIVVASVCLFLVPKKVGVALDNLFDYANALPDNIAGLLDKETILKLNAVSDATRNMAEDVANNNLDKDESSTDEMGAFIKTLNENTCKRCSRYKECWEKNYHNMYETVFNSIETLQTRGSIEEEDLNESICGNKYLLIDGLNFCYQIYKVNQNWQKKMNEKRLQIAKQLKGVSDAIDSATSGIPAEELETQNVETKFSIEVGVSSIKKSGSNISGDNYILTQLNDGKYLIGISDGMGSGEKANEKSKKVVNMLEKLLNTGTSQSKAVEIVNSVMLLSDDDDMYATVDAMTIDLVNGRSDFIKLSACPTYIETKAGVDIINNIALPVGILDNLDVELYDKTIENGDIIVMITDGVMESCETYAKKELWVHDLLQAVNIQKPQRLADVILQEAIDNGFGSVNDDMTVIVAKITG